MLIFFISILIINPVIIIAQVAPESEIEEYIDEIDNYEEGSLDYHELETDEPNEVKEFDQNTYKRAIQGLQYGTDEPPEIKEEKEDSASSPQYAHGAIRTFQIIAALIIAALLIFLLVRTIVLKSGPANKKLRAQEILEEADPEENLHEAPLDALLRKALDAGDYHQALRIYYLKIIKLLSEKGWITWKREKTNFDYLREMGGQTGKENFRQLTIFFELFWYGNADLSREKYERLSLQFQSFINEVNGDTR